MIIGIFGQSGHGRTTFARQLQECLKVQYNLEFDIRPNLSSNDNGYKCIYDNGSTLLEALTIKSHCGYTVYVHRAINLEKVNIKDEMYTVEQWLVKEHNPIKFNKYFNYYCTNNGPVKVLNLHVATVAQTIEWLLKMPQQKQRNLFD